MIISVYKKHIRTMSPSLALFFLMLTIGLILWDTAIIIFIRPVCREFLSLEKLAYSYVVESSDGEIQYPSMKKLSNIITFSNTKKDRMNINTYVIGTATFFSGIHVNPHEIMISEKVAERLDLSVGDRITAEYPVYSEPYEYSIIDILPYGSDLYNVADSSDFSYVIVGDDGILVNQAAGKTFYFLDNTEYHAFMDNEYSYSEQFDITEELHSLSSRQALLYTISLIVLFAFLTIMLYLAHKTISKENLKYYHDGFSVRTVKTIDRLDHLLSCGIPLIVEIIWIFCSSLCKDLPTPFLAVIEVGLIFSAITCIFIGGIRFGKANKA